jgi:DNA invertase Pin-like site-specific DNA recombinase
MEKAVVYYRVSTPRQGKSRLGLEVQQQAVNLYTGFTRTKIVKEYCEIESGKRRNRPELKKALRFCKKHGLVLIIAKVARLARDALFVAGMLERKVKIVAADKPLAGPLDLLEDAIRAQREGEEISQRTKDCLQAAKKRGVQLGKHGKTLARINRQNADAFALRMIPVIETLKAEGFKSEGKLTRQLNSRKIPSFRGARCKWHRSTIHTLLKRIEFIHVRACAGEPVKEPPVQIQS